MTGGAPLVTVLRIELPSGKCPLAIGTDLCLAGLKWKSAGGLNSCADGVEHCAVTMLGWFVWDAGGVQGGWKLCFAFVKVFVMEYLLSALCIMCRTSTMPCSSFVVLVF